MGYSSSTISVHAQQKKSYDIQAFIVVFNVN